MATPRDLALYHRDSLLFSFRANVVALSTHAGRKSVLLDQTAFYPESGGQMADHGTLSGASVVDVQLDEEGRIHHIIEGEAKAVGVEIEGHVDEDRRRVHMALHTGQHLLSRALVDVASAETVSSRLGESACTIDLDLVTLDDASAARAEDLVNGIVDADVPVRASYPTAEELLRLPLRRQPKVTENVRVISIGDFDVSPCGGTHCTSASQIGFVRIESIERYKGRARVVFSAGPRARKKLFRQAEVLRALARDFTCGPEDVPAGIEKVRRELQEAREALGRARSRVAGPLAEELLQRARSRDDRVIVGVLEDASIDLIRAVAGRITAEGDWVAALAGEADGGTLVLIARGPTSKLDCGALLKRAAQAGGGRGGGRPERAEGRLPLGIDWPALMAGALASIG